jgi:hypothetical protein
VTVHVRSCDVRRCNGIELQYSVHERNPMLWPRCHVSFLALVKISELVEGTPCGRQSEEGWERRWVIGWVVLISGSCSS